MATRMKMLKLLQEQRTFTPADFRRPLVRAGALLLPIRSGKKRLPSPRHVIRIRIMEPPDIPCPVPIRFALPAVTGTK